MYYFHHLFLFLVAASYFHSHIFSEKFPSAAISDSKTPTILLRNASLPPEEVLEKTEPHHFTLPEGLILPTHSPVYVTLSCSPPALPAVVVITPCPTP
jgi:hypothetical protein